MRRMTRTLTAVAALAVAGLALAGCTAGSSTDDASTGTLGTVDTMFGEVTVPEPAGDLTVVALGWSDAEMALSLGVVPVGVYDWQSFGADNKAVGPWATDLFGDVTPEIIEDSGDTVNYEQIQALEPDLILNTRSAGDEKQYERLSEIAPTVFAPKGTAAFATPWDVQLEQVAAALGKTQEGDALVSATKQSINEAADLHQEFAGLTTVAATKFGDAYGAYLEGDGRFDILADLGFQQNPAVLDLEASGFYAAVSAEQVSAFDADVAVLLPIGFSAADTTADPLLASLRVVQDGRAIVLDPADELTQAYSAASVLSIPVVLEQLVPKLAEAAAKVAK